MTKRTSSEWDFPTPKEMEGWLEREIADSAKAHELRIRDAARMVAEYSRGDITPEQAERRSIEYDTRWGEALPGVGRSQGMTDEEILTKLDETRRRQESIYRQSRGSMGGHTR